MLLNLYTRSPFKLPALSDLISAKYGEKLGLLILSLLSINSILSRLNLLMPVLL